MNFTINFIFTKSTEFVYNLTRNIGNGVKTALLKFLICCKIYQ